MTIWRLALLVAVLALAAACHEADDVLDQPEPVPAGALAYTGYDENGAPIVEGWVRLDFLGVVSDPAVPSSVTGTWKLRRLAPGGVIGPQVGEGSLEGSLQADQLFVDFNPSRADDNVVAHGTFTLVGGPARGSRWSGSWTWSTLSGPRRKGTFRAEE